MTAALARNVGLVLTDGPSSEGRVFVQIRNQAGLATARKSAIHRVMGTIDKAY